MFCRIYSIYLRGLSFITYVLTGISEMRTLEEQLEIIQKFLNNYFNEHNELPSKKMTVTVRNRREIIEDYEYVQFNQLNLLNGTQLEGAEYVLLCIPRLDNMVIYIGFLEPQKEYSVWELKLDQIPRTGEPGATIKIGKIHQKYMTITELLFLR